MKNLPLNRLSLLTFILTFCILTGCNEAPKVTEYESELSSIFKTNNNLMVTNVDVLNQFKDESSKSSRQILKVMEEVRDELKKPDSPVLVSTSTEKCNCSDCDCNPCCCGEVTEGPSPLTVEEFEKLKESLQENKEVASTETPFTNSTNSGSSLPLGVQPVESGRKQTNLSWKNQGLQSRTAYTTPTQVYSSQGAYHPFLPSNGFASPTMFQSSTYSPPSTTVGPMLQPYSKSYQRGWRNNPWGVDARRYINSRCNCPMCQSLRRMYR